MRPSTILISLAALAIGANAHLNHNIENNHNNKRMLHTKVVKKAQEAAAIEHEQALNQSSEEEVHLEKRGQYSGQATYYATGVG